MHFPIIRLAILAAAGLLLYRTSRPSSEEPAGGSGEEPEAESAAEPQTDDSAAGAEAAAAEPDAPAVEPAASSEVESRAAAASEESGAGALSEPAAAAEPDDLTRVRGIGPALAGLLNAGGITTWSQLAESEVSSLKGILDEAGPRYRMHDPSAWPELAAELAGAN